ncbi:glycyl-radical enzyme activating protein [Candidatus Desantisbacteria bacterium]|nr:glycyl-radical enzyme activating protein [Candidatus Desantisbacteria bacterium]
MTDYPLVFDIKRGSLDNGLGIRTTVFLKGCYLSCIWCHNPESMKPDKEISFKYKRCIMCGECERICPKGAIQLYSRERIDRNVCNACGICARQCCSMAIEEIGRYYPVEDLLAILMRDKLFYDTSGGGVTLSGGEPMYHMDYVGELIRQLKDNGIHTAIQTSGYFDLDSFRMKILPYLDLIYFDLKFIDAKLHRRYTGRDNSRILDNFLWLVDESNIPVIPCIPLIPSITATIENLTEIAAFIKKAGCTDYKFSEYNPLGLSKRNFLDKGLHQEMPSYFLTTEEELGWKHYFKEAIE